MNLNLDLYELVIVHSVSKHVCTCQACGESENNTLAGTFMKEYKLPFKVLFGYNRDCVCCIHGLPGCS